MLGIVEIVQGLLAKHGLTIQRLGIPCGHPFPLLKVLVDQSQRRTGEFRFLQIGAHNGGTEDPIHEMIRERKWTGVLVEPMPALFEALKEAYSDTANTTCVNCAVGKVDGIVAMYYVTNDHSLPGLGEPTGEFRQESHTQAEARHT